MTGRFQGKQAIVTGAASGIGRSAAFRLLEEGASVIAVDRNGDALASIFGDIAEASVCPIDITDGSERRSIWQRGRVDVLVNAAGILLRHPTLTHPLGEWDRTMSVNLRAPFQLIREFAGRCIERDAPGAVVNVCSIESFKALPGHAAYTVSKTGLYMLTRATALELASHRVRVNAIAPGVTATSMNADLRNDASASSVLKARIPMGRFADPDEQAAAIAFLASEEASYVTGAVLTVDGGWTIQ